MAQQRSLIVVADRETAQFHLHPGPGEALEPFGAEILHPSAGDQNADRPGRAFQSYGDRRHAMEPPTGYKELERQSMAHSVAERVQAAFADDMVDRLVLVADPKLLGELRSALDEQTRDRVVLELHHHLTQASPNELARRLTEEVAIGLVREPSIRAGG